MKRIELTCSGPCFIGAWQLADPGLCEDIIRFFEDNRTLHKPGRTSSGVDLGAKKSMDLPVKPRDLSRPEFAPLATFIQALHACYSDYLDQWPFLADAVPELETGVFNIQRYEAGGHFARVHSERTSLDVAHRVLAWMMYLNDVADGGETSFPHYGLDIVPERGKILIWPAEWTHAHCGKVVRSGLKYIVTGWMHFPHPRPD